MKHVMFDLETMGNAPGCVILSVGAVEFDPHTAKLGKEFYATIDIRSCFDLGLKVDASTLVWWMGQGDAARKAAVAPGKPVEEVLKDFAHWFGACGGELIWCHGATFDAPVIEAAFRLAKREAPWKFWNVRDTRTIFDLTGVKVPRAAGTHHNALDDAKNQAAAVGKAYGVLARAKTADMLA